mmetsp:Transcript_98235/g.249308  ORF Transcript_98235/g.249308 Transcript_98235/m.249308 type:complete len:385 (+) Transcript_98235:26-1180(+)
MCAISRLGQLATSQKKSTKRSSTPHSRCEQLRLLLPLRLEFFDPALGQRLTINTVRRHAVVVKLGVHIGFGAEHLLRIQLLFGLLLRGLLRLLVFPTSCGRILVLLLFQAALLQSDDAVENHRARAGAVLVDDEQTIPLELEAVHGFARGHRLLALCIRHHREGVRVHLLEEVIGDVCFFVHLGRRGGLRLCQLLSGVRLRFQEGVVQAHRVGAAVLLGHPVDDTLDLAVGGHLIPRRWIMGASQLRHVARFILDHLLARDDVAVSQLDLAAGLEPEEGIGSVLAEVFLLDEDHTRELDLARAHVRVGRMVRSLHLLDLALGVVLDDHLERVDDHHPPRQDGVQVLTNAILEHGDISHSDLLGHTKLQDEFFEGFGCDTSSAHA